MKAFFTKQKHVAKKTNIFFYFSYFWEDNLLAIGTFINYVNQI